jgi:ribonuclease VapC
MIIDPSAIVAILKKEDDADRLLRALAASPANRMSTVGYVEACIAADNPINAFDRATLDQLLAALNVELVPITIVQSGLAADAHTRFGRWSRSPAKLNFGDCFSYALAIDRDEPLLFKGDDFGHTDVRVA